MEFILGCNYWASDSGTDMWRTFNIVAIKKDLRTLSEYFSPSMYALIMSISRSSVLRCLSRILWNPTPCIRIYTIHLQHSVFPHSSHPSLSSPALPRDNSAKKQLTINPIARRHQNSLSLEQPLSTSSAKQPFYGYACHPLLLSSNLNCGNSAALRQTILQRMTNVNAPLRIIQPKFVFHCGVRQGHT